MKIRVNGKSIEVDEGINILQLANVLNLDISKTVVEVNNEIIDKKNFDKKIIAQNDKIEFIQFVGGG